MVRPAKGREPRQTTGFKSSFVMSRQRSNSHRAPECRSGHSPPVAERNPERSVVRFLRSKQAGRLQPRKLPSRLFSATADYVMAGPDDSRAHF